MKDTKFRTLNPQKDCCNPERDAGDSHRRSSDTRRQEFPKAIQNRLLRVLMSPEYLSGDYVDFRVYYHALLPSDANYVPPTTPAQRDVNKATHTLSRTHLESVGADLQVSEEGRGCASRSGPQAIVDDCDDRSRPGPQAIVENDFMTSYHQQERTEQDRDHDTLQSSCHQSSFAYLMVSDVPYGTIDEDESHHIPAAATTLTTRIMPQAQPLPKSQNQEPSLAHKGDYDAAFTAYEVAL
ncbi:hypothetical protein BGZ90_011856 [Linnemannia elongata]|nr:hypothetical protein BGZ90_011856 [Linnemannia elongata]